MTCTVCGEAKDRNFGSINLSHLELSSLEDDITEVPTISLDFRVKLSNMPLLKTDLSGKYPVCCKVEYKKFSRTWTQTFPNTKEDKILKPFRLNYEISTEQKVRYQLMGR